jgi:hypothetical protein
MPNCVYIRLPPQAGWLLGIVHLGRSLSVNSKQADITIGNRVSLGTSRDLGNVFANIVKKLGHIHKNLMQEDERYLQKLF